MSLVIVDLKAAVIEPYGTIARQSANLMIQLCSNSLGFVHLVRQCSTNARVWQSFWLCIVQWCWRLETHRSLQVCSNFLSFAHTVTPRRIIFVWTWLWQVTSSPIHDRFVGSLNTCTSPFSGFYGLRWGFVNIVWGSIATAVFIFVNIIVCSSR